MTKFAEIFFDDQDPANKGWAYRFFRRDPDPMISGREDFESGSIESLDDLLYALQHEVEDDRIMSDLPTFGGDEPDDTSEIYSWDAERLLVSDGSGGFEIVAR